jgi:hypothetical protein
MFDYFEDFFRFMKPAFSRKVTFHWFIIFVIGSITRWDYLGISSIVRALSFDYYSYANLLHFFHSSAYSCSSILVLWWKWVIHKNIAVTVNERLILLGDHTQVPKEGVKMPGVRTLHQNSETSAKPSFFRGFLWGCISILISAPDKKIAVPLKMSPYISDSNTKTKDDNQKMTLSIFNIALEIAQKTFKKYYLVLDAFFPSGDMFKATLTNICPILKEPFIHLIIRAKKSFVAYDIPKKETKKRRGPKRKYGKKYKLFELFNLWHDKFQNVTGTIYGKSESFSILCLDLIWKPFGKTVRFVLANTSHGLIIVMCSDLSIAPVKIIEIYSYRSKIETMFSVFKHFIGGFTFRFWSKYMTKQKRCPSKKKPQPIFQSSNSKKTNNTLEAIKKFVNLQCVILGFLEFIAMDFKDAIWDKSNCWLRTYSSNTPSVFITKITITQIIKNKLFTFGKNWIIDLILVKQSYFKYNQNLKEAS